MAIIGSLVTARESEPILLPDMNGPIKERGLSGPLSIRRAEYMGTAVGRLTSPDSRYLVTLLGESPLHSVVLPLLSLVDADGREGPLLTTRASEGETDTMPSIEPLVGRAPPRHTESMVQRPDHAPDAKPS